MANGTPGAKERALKGHGCFNGQAKAVQDELFVSNPFFDPRDMVQVKYEMLRRVREDGAPVSRAAASFGVSRPTWYQAQRAFEAGGLPALVPQRPGPRGPHKLTDDVVEALRRARTERPATTAAELAGIARERFGVSVHPRSIERALARVKKCRDANNGAARTRDGTLDLLSRLRAAALPRGQARHRTRPPRPRHGGAARRGRVAGYLRGVACDCIRRAGERLRRIAARGVAGAAGRHPGGDGQRPDGEGIGMSVGHQKVTAGHLRRDAYLYVRQSTMRQVFEHGESTRRQYALRERAVALGWPTERVNVIDSDLGRSGADSDREGFQRLVAEVGMGRAGIVLGLEVSRLARNSTDWHRLLEICALAETLILDEDGVYDPGDFNDRLLLGLKGTMSEAELHMLRARLRGGILNQARRGALRTPLPVGLVYDAAGNVALDPDEQVRHSLRLLFDTFVRTGSARATVRYFRAEDIRFPVRLRGGTRKGELHWQPLLVSRTLGVLHNPRYAGAFAFGRTRHRRLPAEASGSSTCREGNGRCCCRTRTPATSPGNGSKPTSGNCSAMRGPTARTVPLPRAKGPRCCRDWPSAANAVGACRCATTLAKQDRRQTTSAITRPPRWLKPSARTSPALASTGRSARCWWN